MSRELFDAVWRNSSARGLDLLVLVAVADGTEDAKGPWFDISMRHLAKRCRAGVRAVQVAVRRLEATGQLRVQGLAGRHGWNRYQAVPPSEDKRPTAPRPITEAQRNRCRAGAAARWATHPDASNMHPDAPPILAITHPDAPGARIPMHQGDASGCVAPMHPDAQTHASGCTQDGERTVSSPSSKARDGGVPPPGDKKKAPPRPPRGGKGTHATGKPTLRAMVDALMPKANDPAIINQQSHEALKPSP